MYSPVLVQHSDGQARRLPTNGGGEAYIPGGYTRHIPGSTMRFMVHNLPYSPKEWLSDAPRYEQISQRMALRSASLCPVLPKEWFSDAPRCAHPSLLTRVYPPGYTSLPYPGIPTVVHPPTIPGYTHRCTPLIHTPGIPTVVPLSYPPWVYPPLYTLHTHPGYTHHCTPCIYTPGIPTVVHPVYTPLVYPPLYTF